MGSVQAFMEQRNLSKEDIAEITGVTERTVSNWIAGTTHKPLAVTLMIQAVEAELISLDWWREAAKAAKGEQ